MIKTLKYTVNRHAAIANFANSHDLSLEDVYNYLKVNAEFLMNINLYKGDAILEKSVEEIKDLIEILYNFSKLEVIS